MSFRMCGTEFFISQRINGQYSLAYETVNDQGNNLAKNPVWGKINTAYFYVFVSQ